MATRRGKNCFGIGIFTNGKLYFWKDVKLINTSHNPGMPITTEIMYKDGHENIVACSLKRAKEFLGYPPPKLKVNWPPKPDKLDLD